MSNFEYVQRRIEIEKEQARKEERERILELLKKHAPYTKWKLYKRVIENE